MCGIFCRRSSILVDEPDSFISFHDIPDNSHSCQPGLNLSLEGEGIYSLKTSNCKYTVFQQTEQTGDFDATTDGPDSSVCAYAFNSLRKKSSARGRWTMAFKDYNLVTLPVPGGLKPCCSGRKHKNACCEHPRDLRPWAR